MSIEEKSRESSIIEPSCSKVSIEEKFGESSIIEPSCSECSEGCLYFAGPPSPESCDNIAEPPSPESCVEVAEGPECQIRSFDEESHLDSVRLDLTNDPCDSLGVEREREAPEYDESFGASYYTEV